MRIFAAHESICLHTDVSAFGFLDSPSPPREAVRRFADAILNAAEGRVLLLPTFNYDYTRTRVYDVVNDPCQVGVLNEHFRRRTGTRTLTPVFNFLAINDSNGRFPTAPAPDPFGEFSTFRRMRSNKTLICALGAPLAASLTIAHHAEQSAGVGYRYIKPFPGRAISPDGVIHVLDGFHFRARVLNPEMPSYDYPRWEAELLSEGIIQKHQLGAGTVVTYRADQHFDYWYARLKENELHPFSEADRVKVRALYEKYGYPFKLEMFE